MSIAAALTVTAARRATDHAAQLAAAHNPRAAVALSDGTRPASVKPETHRRRVAIGPHSPCRVEVPTGRVRGPAPRPSSELEPHTPHRLRPPPPPPTRTRAPAPRPPAREQPACSTRERKNCNRRPVGGSGHLDASRARRQAGIGTRPRRLTARVLSLAIGWVRRH